MPIVNVALRAQKLPRIGTIRKGIKKPVIDKNTGEPRVGARGEIVTYPSEVPYFVFNTDPTDTKTPEIIAEKYGLEPMEIDVYLPFRTVEANWDYWLEAYVFSQMVGRSDGQVVKFLRDIETGEMLIKNGQVVAHSSDPTSAAGQLVNDLKIGDILGYYDEMVLARTGNDKENEVRFKAVGRLQVVLPVLNRMATFTVMTGSLYYDIPFINSAIDVAQDIAHALNINLNTIPMKLRRVPIEVSVPGKDGTRKKVTKHFIQMEVNPDFVAEMMKLHSRLPSLTSASSPERYPQLDAGDYVEEDESIDAPEEVESILQGMEEDPQLPEQPPHEEVVADPNRPYPPDVFGDKFIELKSTYSTNWAKKGLQPEFSKQYTQMIAKWLNDIFEKDEEKRHRFLDGLGIPGGSTKDMTVVEGYSIRRVMGIGIWDFDSVPSEVSQIEIRQYEDFLLGQEMGK